MKQKIAAITMARNDNYFLSKWIKYYGEELGYENLYVYLDGTDQELPIGASKINIKKLPHPNLSRTAGDKYRIRMMNELAAKLFRAGYKLVIGTDSDEFLVTDPATGKTLSQYLSDTEIKTTLSGLGLDIGQHLNMEYELNPKLSLLSQREYALLSTRFTKTSIITRGKKWGSGFHSIKGTNFHIDPNLYLLHFGSVDYEQIRQKMKSRDKSWGKHTMRRAENIILITNKKPRDFDITTSRARKLQKWLRPIYAWNKPAMFGLKWTVQLPERFLSALRNKI